MLFSGFVNAFPDLETVKQFLRSRFAKRIIMCNYHTWFHNEKSGYVIECVHCNKIQVCFGNLLLSFPPEAFENFRHYVGKKAEAITSTADRYIKSIVLNTDCEGVNMLLTEAELDGLYQMLEYADTEMKAAAFIKMFNDPL